MRSVRCAYGVLNMADAITPPPIPLRRPRLVWVIFFSYVIGAGSFYIIQLEMIFGLAKLSAKQQALVDNLSTGVILYSTIAPILYMVAATTLWRLRRVALPLFSLCLVLTIGSIFRDLLPGGASSTRIARGGAMAAAEFLGTGFGFFVTAGVWAYTFHLWRRGMLK